MNAITIYNNGYISSDGEDTRMSYKQTKAGTRVFSRTDLKDVKMPYSRYSLSSDQPAPGVAGRKQFEADLLALLS